MSDFGEGPKEKPYVTRKDIINMAAIFAGALILPACATSKPKEMSNKNPEDKILDLKDNQQIRFKIGDGWQNFVVRRAENSGRDIEKLCVRVPKNEDERELIDFEKQDTCKPLMELKEWETPIERKFGEIFSNTLWKVMGKADQLDSEVSVGLWESPRSRTRRVGELSDLPGEVFALAVIGNPEDWIMDPDTPTTLKTFDAKINGKDVKVGGVFALCTLSNEKNDTNFQTLNVHGYVNDMEALKIE